MRKKGKSHIQQWDKEKVLGRMYLRKGRSSSLSKGEKGGIPFLYREEGVLFL